ncbi:substrate-binding periplasmic protein [Microbulbifer yueqingensis]|uniref:Extracellular solute-binding protein, family 3 n=1 Tax=Microbulbifer yueqingensis TaxID=658219 RepID=A0A1G8Y5H7_9GAMM|nr:transporter substrate-binding domain-containing protein [Microbulbifer yueqingensis]SDJ98056.1 extracellular solute-binding protein, family 3 [Microbulbifer yueqingensis]
MRERYGSFWYAAVFFMLPVLLGTGCERFPRDPQHSLKQVQERGKLRVGVVSHKPWVTGNAPGKPGGIEASLLEAFARELEVEIEWHWGSAQEHFEALKHYELDVVAGGITRSNPWRKEVGFTSPYYVSHAVVGVPQSGERISSVEGRAVALRPDSGLHHLLKERGARPFKRGYLENVDMPVAAEAWEIERLGLRKTDITLTKRRYVMAVPSGENALIMRLENFLMQKASPGRVEKLLAGRSQE